ncbi:MAG TPA: ATP-binding cassette domain-containing protein [Candidatus Omnitrophota bacterium]|nr:ATP-binding cassette domain-containing protein [Candidatus Omnitrophota bacterium]
MIVVESIAKSFRAVTALDDVSFTAADGSITGLIGPNGAGKTTMMRLLTSVMRPDRGRATIDGFDVATQPMDSLRRLGVLPDVRGLYPRLTTREHLRYVGRLHGMDKAALERRIDELAGMLEMGDILDRRTKGFSRGQSLKVALARALIHDPPNILLDEPTNGLDIASSRAMRALIHSLKEQGRCIVFCSHIMAEVAALCDRLVVLAHGRVVAQGSVEELFAATGTKAMEEMFLVLTREAAAP